MKLTAPQRAALIFALTEGHVGPGCKGYANDTERHSATNETLGSLVDAKLLAPTAICEGEVWMMLTPSGASEARASFVATRGYEWSHPVKTVEAAS